MCIRDRSQAGVTVDLIVRGICCLRPGLEGVSENITVRSIVGRFLEHERVFYFQNSDAEPKVYLSSADLMPRNLRNRIEQCTPILNEKIKERIINDLELYLKDNSGAWLMQENGEYILSIPCIQSDESESSNIDAQQVLLNELAESF